MKTWLLAASLLLASTAFAQLPINIGIKGGANYSLINTESSGLSTSGNAGYLGGAFVRLKIKKLSVQAEGLFVGVRGKSERNPLPTLKIEDEISYSNFDVPILVGYKFLDLKLVKFRVNGGITQSFNAFTGGDDSNFDFEDSYTSGVIGVSCDIPLLVFDLRYQHTFNDFATYNTVNTLRNDGLSNGLISLSVGWKIL